MNLEMVFNGISSSFEAFFCFFRDQIHGWAQGELQPTSNGEIQTRVLESLRMVLMDYLEYNEATFASQWDQTLGLTWVLELGHQIGAFAHEGF